MQGLDLSTPYHLLFVFSCLLFSCPIFFSFFFFKSFVIHPPELFFFPA